jgi:ABC-type uncharacterized transport system permease subunit
MKKIGVIIILLGLGITAFTTISYFSKKKEVELPKTETSGNKSLHLILSPITGIAIMGIGGIVFWQTYNPQ